jgi:hypothetical protein
MSSAKFPNALAILQMGVFCVSIFGQSPTWSGTWTLDSDSQQAKPAISFTAKSDGTYELVSSTVIAQFRCDGKSYPMLGRAGQPGIGNAICSALSKKSMDITFQNKDTHPTVGHLQVSSDAKSLIYTLETVDSSGKKQVKVRNYARLSGSDGLVGGWRNVDPNPSQVLKVTLSQQAIIMEYPLAHHIAALPLSGAEIHALVSGVPAKNTQALHLDDSHKFQVSTLQERVVIGRAVFSLSPDGSVITERFWLEQHPEEVASYTYRRSH